MILFMLQARSEDGELITLAMLTKDKIEYLRKENQFFCPMCNGQVIIKAGTEMIPHFAHKALSQCPSYMGGESQYHMQGKVSLKYWLKQQNISVKLEPYLKSINQVPDLLIELNNKKIAIEFQCARIPIKEVKKRNIGYEQVGIVPIWILGKKLLKTSSNRIQISPFILQFIHQFNQSMPTVLYFLCPHTKQLYTISNLYLSSQTRAFYQMEIKPLSSLTFKQLFTVRNIPITQILSQWKQELRRFRTHPRYQAYGEELKWRTWLYYKRISIEQLPTFVHLPTMSQQFMTVPSWNWQSRLYFDLIDRLQRQEQFTIEQCEYILKYYSLPHNHFPLIKDSKSPIKYYLQHLEKLHIIKQLSDTTFQKQQSIPVYKNIEQALKGDHVLLNELMYNYS